MKKYSYIFPLLAFLLITAGCKSARIESVIPEQTLVIDGHEEEWKDVPFICFGEAKISVKAANDEKNLYLFLRFTDRQVARRIQMFGITYYLNPRGKKGEDFRIKFRNDSMLGRRGRMPDGFSGRGMKDFDREPELPLFGNLSAVEFLDEIPVEVYPINNEDGPMCAFTVEQGIKNYEFRIPLRMVDNDYKEIDLSREEIIGLGFEIGKPDLSEMPDRRGGGGRGGIGPGGGMSPPGGGMGGMGGGRGGGGMMRGGRMAGQDEIKLWTKITLAKRN